MKTMGPDGRENYDWVTCGMHVWASAFRLTENKASLSLRQEPVPGIAAYSQYEIATGPEIPGKPGTGRDMSGMAARWFVPFKKNSEDPAWSKAVRIESRDIASTRAEAEEMYRDRILAEADWLEARAAWIRGYLEKT